MRLHILSDLHADLTGNSLDALPQVEADVRVVAGDAMAPGIEALRLIRRLFPDPDVKIVATAGNHDFYSEGDRKLVAANPSLRTTYEEQRALMPEVARQLGIILLDDSAVEIDGVRFVGATLWTDMSARPPYMSINEAMRSAERMNDYRLIKTGRGRSKDRLRPADTIAAHRRSVDFIESVLTVPYAGNTVLVTHHPACLQSLAGYDPARPENFRDMDHCYATDLSRWFTGEGMPPDYVPPALAIHGHVHENRDYTIGGTRIVSNPRGYPLYAHSTAPRENPHFDPGLVVEVGRDLTPTWRI